MPEAPEIRAHAHRLAESFVGSELTGVQALSFTVAKTFDPPIDAAIGETLERVGHRGKHLLLGFGPITHVVHLMQGGRLEPDPKQSRRPRGGLLRWQFDDDALLLREAGTEHRAGVWAVRGDPLDQEPLADLGPEADSLDTEAMTELLALRNRRLHGLLRDQRALAGIGRRLANEVCHRARLSPFASTTKLTGDEIDRLVRSIGELIAEGIAAESDLEKMSASAERPGAVHHRKGETCPVCEDTVREVAYNRYTVNYCPTCQTDGKVLADNTTSRFLK